MLWNVSSAIYVSSMMKTGESYVPRYYFEVHAPDHRYNDPNGTHLLDHGAARAYARRIIQELKDGGYSSSGTTMVVQDEAGNTVHSIDF